MTTHAKQVAEITVIDPDSSLPVEVGIYKEEASGAMFGIDSSYVAQLGEDETVLSVFGNGRVVIDG